MKRTKEIKPVTKKIPEVWHEGDYWWTVQCISQERISVDGKLVEIVNRYKVLKEEFTGKGGYSGRAEV